MTLFVRGKIVSPEIIGLLSKDSRILNNSESLNCEFDIEWIDDGALMQLSQAFGRSPSPLKASDFYHLISNWEVAKPKQKCPNHRRMDKKLRRGKK